MTDRSAQEFLGDLDRTLWAAADRLRASLDAAVYKHAVLGLNFLKHGSDSFAARQAESPFGLGLFPSEGMPTGLRPA